jgi:hypothetical protein
MKEGIKWFQDVLVMLNVHKLTLFTSQNLRL